MHGIVDVLYVSKISCTGDSGIKTLPVGGTIGVPGS